MHTRRQETGIAIFTCAVLLIAAASSSRAAPHSENNDRPRIGLVLAGGGAKGGAHIGVLKVLEELHVPIDCIAGTSMGALVGGGYASGIPAAELEEFIVGIDWQKVVGSQGRRDLEPIEQKRAGATYSNNLEFGITSNGLTTAGGLINTSSIEDLLRLYVASARFEADFDKLPIPFRAVATDMVSGNMVVLEDGDLATAMRASMAIPGAFAPVRLEDMILSDGGLVRNIPVDVARNLCADIVIVVNLVELPADPAKLQSATQILGRTMDVMIVANETLQLNSLAADDILIDVEMGTIGTADFERTAETVVLGETAARDMSAALAKYAVPEATYLAWRADVTDTQKLEARLADVRFEGLERVNPEFLASDEQVKAGDLVDANTISAQAQRIAVLQDFDSVGYRLDGDPASPTLTWLPKEKQLGPDYLRLDMGAYASWDGDLRFLLYGRHVRTWVNALGAEWRNEVQIGGETLLATSLYQPLDTAQKFFVEPRAWFSRSTEDVFDDGERVARYSFQDSTAALAAGINLSRFAQARVSYLYDQRDIDVDIGSELLPANDFVDAGILVSAVYDSRDTPFGPTSGVALALEYLDIDDSLGADRDWQRAEIGAGIAIPLRRDVIWVSAAGGSDLDDSLPPDRKFALGGPASLPGLELGELRADSYWIIDSSYLWKLKDVLPIRNLALYGGVRLTGGAVHGRLDGEDGGEFYGGSVYLAGRTIIGPMTLGIGSTSLDSWSLWLTIGRPVGHGTIMDRGIFR
jgi:NTE family protein